MISKTKDITKDTDYFNNYPPRLLITLNNNWFYNIGWVKNISRGYKWGILRIVEMESGGGGRRVAE